MSSSCAAQYARSCAAYPQSGGHNKSGLHWDMVCDLREGGVVKVDGEVISENGVFAHPDWPR